MQLHTVEITNIRAVEYLKFQAGALTVIRADNGVGKTSVMDGIKAVFAGGHDPTLLRQGSKKGSVLLTMDDGTTVEKAITAKTSSLTVKTAEGTIVPAPAGFVAALAKGFAFDPLAFISAPKADRAKYIASAMPISVGKRDIISSVELKPMAEKVQSALDEQSEANTFDLPQLMVIRKAIYDSRSVASKQRKTQESAIDALRKSLPANWKPDGDADLIVANAQADVNEAKEALQTITAQRDQRVVDLDKASAADVAAVAQWEAEEIDKIRQKATSQRETIAAAYKDVRDSAYHAMDPEMEAAQEKITAAVSNLNAARESAKSFAVQAQTAATVAQYSKDLKESIATEDALTATLEAIDAAKEKAMKQTPIPEITTVDGEVYVKQPGLDEPVPFDAVNTQKQWMLALKIASLGAGSLGLMCVDGSEAIVGENFEKFRSACVESGFQVIATRADEAYKQLDVETISSQA